jgi:D-inositol-3-phosphate glycosyltransferase
VPGLVITVVPPGIEIGSRQDAIIPDPLMSPYRRFVLSVGRLSSYKRVDQIVRAMPYVDPDTALIVVGEGPAASDILLEAQRLGLGDRVKLLGAVSDAELSGWYRRADAFVTLSAEESFGLTVLEAASCGAPVVASDIPAHREVSRHAERGRVTLVDVAAGDETIAKALGAALELGRDDGASVAGIPTWHDFVDAVLRIYASAINDRGESTSRG